MFCAKAFNGEAGEHLYRHKISQGSRRVADFFKIINTYDNFATIAIYPTFDTSDTSETSFLVIFGQNLVIET